MHSSLSREGEGPRSDIGLFLVTEIDWWRASVIFEQLEMQQSQGIEYVIF